MIDTGHPTITIGTSDTRSDRSRCGQIKSASIQARAGLTPGKNPSSCRPMRMIPQPITPGGGGRDSRANHGRRPPNHGRHILCAPWALMTTIKELRLARGLTPESLASSIGISLAEYRDLEQHPYELHTGASVKSLAQLARLLGVKPSTFYEGTASATLSLDELARRIATHLQQTKESMARLEESVGWELAGALATPSRFLDFPADGLRDVCAHVGLNWLEVLDGLAG